MDYNAKRPVNTQLFFLHNKYFVWYKAWWEKLRYKMQLTIPHFSCSSQHCVCYRLLRPIRRASTSLNVSLCSLSAHSGSPQVFREAIKTTEKGAYESASSTKNAVTTVLHFLPFF